MDYNQFKKVKVEKDGRLLLVTLNRPDRMNAIDVSHGDEIGLHEELGDLFSLLNKDLSIGAMLLTGAGRAFSAGGDVKQMQTTTVGRASGVSPEDMEDAKRLLLNLLRLDLPTIAAINGP